MSKQPNEHFNNEEQAEEVVDVVAEHRNLVFCRVAHALGIELWSLRQYTAKNHCSTCACTACQRRCVRACVRACACERTTRACERTCVRASLHNELLHVHMLVFLCLRVYRGHAFHVKTRACVIVGACACAYMHAHTGVCTCTELTQDCCIGQDFKIPPVHAFLEERDPIEAFVSLYK